MNEPEHSGDPKERDGITLDMETSDCVPPVSAQFRGPLMWPSQVPKVKDPALDVQAKPRAAGGDSNKANNRHVGLEDKRRSSKSSSSGPSDADGNSTARLAALNLKDMEPRMWLESVLIAERTAMTCTLQERHKRLLENFEVMLAQHTERVLARSAKSGKNAHLDVESNSIAPTVIDRSPFASPRPAHQHQGDVRLPPQDSEGHGALVRSNSVATSGKFRVWQASLGRMFGSSREEIKTTVQQWTDKVGVFSPLQRMSRSVSDLRGESWNETFQRLVRSTAFELFFGTLIILNTGLMALERQYHGFDTAFLLSYKNTTLTAADEWPGADDAILVAEDIFGFLFTLELLLKMAVLRHLFLASVWNLFDALVVGLWFIDRNYGGLPLNPLILRLGRIARLLRLLRVVRWIAIFDPLHLIVKAVGSSISVLLWSIIVLVLTMVAVAMLTSQFVETFIRDEKQAMYARVAVFESWGTFTRSMVTMFEISLANWVPQCRLLMDEVSESWALFFLLYKCTFGFAVLQVITAVFIQQTFKVAARDEEVMISEKKAASVAMLKNLGHLFQRLDVSGDGMLTHEEFETVLQDTRVQTWFSAVEIDASDISELFHLLDDGDGLISREEFIKGVKAIKGFAKASDMMILMNRLRSVNRHISHLDAKIDEVKDFFFPAEARSMMAMTTSFDVKGFGAMQSVAKTPQLA